MTEYAVKPGGTPTWYRDATANDSDKSITVPAGKKWRINYIHAEIACSATVGNRQLWMTMTDGTNVILVPPKLSAMAAFSTAVIELATSATFTSTAAQVPLFSGVAPTQAERFPIPPDLVLLPGYVIRAYDTQAVAVAEDDLTIVMQYIEYDA